MTNNEQAFTTSIYYVMNLLHYTTLHSPSVFAKLTDNNLISQNKNTGSVMAFLKQLNEHNNLLLAPHHSFGRLSSAVDTVVSNPQISKYHTLIEWREQCWQLRDFSTNGTWINGHRVAPNQQHKLKPGDLIALASHDNPVFEVVDLAPPSDTLLRLDANDNIIEVMPLGQYNLLPNEQEPQMVLYNHVDQQQWFIEMLDSIEPQSTAINDGEIITISDQQWQLKRCIAPQQTELHMPCLPTIDELTFEFNLSSDEEDVELTVDTTTERVELLTRCHHYLNVLLARAKYQDNKTGLPHQQQGWVYPEALCRDLGIDISHLNIQIHRARKQFCDNITLLDNQPLIERKGGKLRFAGSRFKITKGGELECEYAINRGQKVA